MYNSHAQPGGEKTVVEATTHEATPDEGTTNEAKRLARQEKQIGEALDLGLVLACIQREFAERDLLWPRALLPWRVRRACLCSPRDRRGRRAHRPLHLTHRT